MEQMGNAFWEVAWAIVGFLETVLVWIQGLFGDLYTVLSEFFKLRFQFRIASHTIMLPIAVTILILALLARVITGVFRRRKRRRRLH